MSDYFQRKDDLLAEMGESLPFRIDVSLSGGVCASPMPQRMCPITDSSASFEDAF